MNENLEKLETSLKAAFSSYVVRLESVPNEPLLVGVGVYGVANERVLQIAERIAELEEQLFPSGELGLVPLIRNTITTAKYYPDRLRPVPVKWETLSIRQLWTAVHAVAPVIVPAAREQLALAA